MSSSISSATVAVEKATSDLLIGPDWTMNIDICDSVNSSHWQAKDVVKAVKRRLQHKNAKVQLLALTLLETMVKNCGDFVHFQIAEKNILGEMVKIVKKKADMQVRDKILSLLDSWQEAFGGAGGKFPQYYLAYDELRRSGVEFPKRLLDSAPIFTPPATHPNLRHAHAGYGMPIGSSRRLDETMATEIESLSLSSLESMQNVVELLDDMLQAVNPSDRVAVKDEVIVDLVSQCRSNQKKLMQMLTTTGDEELLARGLELNDSLQSLLAKHDAIASGSPFPTQHTNISSKPTNVSTAAKPTDLRDSSPQSSSNPPTPVATNIRNQIDEDEEEEDDFAQLARRHSRVQLTASPTTSAENNGSPMSMDNNNNTTSQMPAILDPAPCNTLSLPDPPAPSRTTNEQEIIDLLSITLSTTAASPCTPPHPSASNQSMHQTSVSTSMQGCPRASQTNLGSEEQVPFNSYVVPWAQSQLQTQSQLGQHLQSRSQLRPHPQRELQAPYQAPFQMQSQPQFLPQSQSQLQSRLQPQIQQQFNPQYSQYSSGYPPPPWAASSENYNHRRNLSNNTPRATVSSTQPLQVVRPLQQYNSFPARAANGSPTNGVQNITRNPASAAGQKPFIPSYRLFEDLNVLGSAEGRLSSKSPSLAGTSGQGMLGGRK